MSVRGGVEESPSRQTPGAGRPPGRARVTRIPSVRHLPRQRSPGWLIWLPPAIPALALVLLAALIAVWLVVRRAVLRPIGHAAAFARLVGQLQERRAGVTLCLPPCRFCLQRAQSPPEVLRGLQSGRRALLGPVKPLLRVLAGSPCRGYGLTQPDDAGLMLLVRGS